MNEKSIKLLIENGVVKKAYITSTGATFHIEFETERDRVISETTTGSIKTWASIDSAAKWLKRLGIGHAELHISRWEPNQKAFHLGGP
jgi:hypothetical protein